MQIELFIVDGILPAIIGNAEKGVEKECNLVAQFQRRTECQTGKIFPFMTESVMT